MSTIETPVQFDSRLHGQLLESVVKYNRQHLLEPHILKDEKKKQQKNYMNEWGRNVYYKNNSKNSTHHTGDPLSNIHDSNNQPSSNNSAIDRIGDFMGLINSKRVLYYIYLFNCRMHGAKGE